MRVRSVLGPALSLLLLVPGSTLAQDESIVPGEASATPQGSSAPETTAARKDLYLDMPYYLGGFEPDIVMTRGQEHLANLPPDDEARVTLQTLLAAVDADIEDMTSGYALVSQEDFFSFVVAIRITGVEPGTLLPAYLPILDADLDDPNGIIGNVGGKRVLIISSIGSDDEYVELFVYDEGDTIWMVQGPKEVVEVTLESLPDAIPAQ